MKHLEILATDAKRPYCINTDCRYRGKYLQCNNHSYVLCTKFEAWYERKQQEEKVKENPQ